MTGGGAARAASPLFFLAARRTIASREDPLAYEALARKYRPRTFEEVVGQGPIVKTLGNALREKRIHHAYVFSGVRGVGKTTVARIFAKALNCEKGPTPTPCLKCDPCVEIAAGRDLDVIEMDAASRTGVDDVRDLIDTTPLRPRARSLQGLHHRRVPHALQARVQCASQTLEEPPARVVFIMATTELHKVLPTVLSRTQQFDFRKVAVQEIADQLGAIAKAEKVKAPRAALEMLARAGDGSVRDAESLLDQAIAFCGSEIGEAEVRTLLGLVPEETVEAFLGAVADRDAGALVRMIAAALAEGLDLRLFHAGLVEGVRRLLVLKSVTEPSEILGLSSEDEKRLASLAGRFSTDSLLRVFSVLAGLEAPLKYSDQPRYLLEAAAIRMSSIAELSPIEDLIARLEGGDPRPLPPRPSAPGAAPRTSPAAPGARPAPASPAGRSGAPARRTRSEANGEEIGATDAVDAPSPANDDPGPGDGDRGPAEPGVETPVVAEMPGAPLAAGGDESVLVPTFLARLRERKEALAMLVEHASAVYQEGRKLIVLFDDAQTFLRKSAEQPANVTILKETAAALLGAGGSAEIRRGPGPGRSRLTRADDPTLHGRGHGGRRRHGHGCPRGGPRRNRAPRARPSLTAVRSDRHGSRRPSALRTAGARSSGRGIPRFRRRRRAPRRGSSGRGRRAAKGGRLSGRTRFRSSFIRRIRRSRGRDRRPLSAAARAGARGSRGQEPREPLRGTHRRDQGGPVNPKQLMRQMQEMQEKLTRDMDAMRIEGSSGGGVVTAVLNGQKALVSLRIAPEAVTPDDVEMLQDLVVAAVNDASRKVDEAVKDQIGGLTGGLKIPGLF
jgi:DNA polymerase-3 subunit gamma/tau